MDHCGTKLKPTRFGSDDGQRMMYGCFGKSYWRFVSVDSDGTTATVGPHYTSKAELLADASRYCTDYGYALV